MGDLATIVRSEYERFVSTRRTTKDQRKALQAIARCRTEELGLLRAECDGCGATHVLFRSCRHRACPRCQANARTDWLEARTQDLLPVPYFHVVFTVPDVLNPIAQFCPEVFYAALMRAAGRALLDVGRSKLKADLGALCVLHTWGQTLTLHPHVHCVVPGGGFRGDRNAWVSVRKPTFFLPVKVLSRRFRTLLRDALRQAFRSGKLHRLPHGVARDVTSFDQLLEQASQSEWVVYTKPPFGGPEQVLAYLAAYTHRLAISNRRIVAFDGQTVKFEWRDYRNGNQSRLLELDAGEFLRRFAMHVLPSGFVRIRYVGFLGNRHRRAHLELARRLIGQVAVRLREPRKRNTVTCPDCRTGTLVITGPWLGPILVSSRAPPQEKRFR
jgi:hypothetical protein